jgi:hypothetical protein
MLQLRKQSVVPVYSLAVAADRGNMRIAERLD